MQTNASAIGETEAAAKDLGPLAWVLEELKKSLDGATKAMRRFVRDAELARGSDLAALDASQLRIARQQLHQAVGALEMVGFSAPAKVMRVMEALAQKFVQRPELCSDDAANKMERASFALVEYLEGVLKGKNASPVALFSQYRDVTDLVGGERVHPADLWPIDFTWIDPVVAVNTVPLAYDPAVRAQLDQSVLKLVKTGDAKSAKTLRDLSLGLASAQPTLEARVFWKICAAFFEANALGLCITDVYAKRAASRVLMQYATLAKGDQSVSDRQAQDLLFFCAQAHPQNAANAPVLTAVRQAYHLTRTKPFSYEIAQFGRFDPSLLIQVRKRINTATETWSSLAGGDTNRLKVVSDQFAAVADSVVKLHPESNELARALTQAVDLTVKSGEPPSTPVAMEVATAVLYLEAAYDDMDPTDSQMAVRSGRLAQRLAQVCDGGHSEPLESWMEDLYRRVSDRQTMGSVVDELRNSLGEVEKSLDQFFRNPHDKLPLHEVPSQLAQMRGVFSVLGLDQASVAMLRMRDTVEKLLIDDVVAGSGSIGVFEKLGNSIGAVGFLIDMLSYQRAMAKKLFVYDEEDGEFKPVMGREKTAAAELDSSAPTEMEMAALATVAMSSRPAPLASESPPIQSDAAVAGAVSAATPVVALDDDEAEIRDIFLEEAAEVVQNGLAAVRALAGNPANLGEQTTLRRAFHTLKGSSRMIGLTEFGEAAWSMEQLLNSWLAEQKPANDDLIQLSGKAMTGFGSWVKHIAAHTDAHWTASGFSQAADALRTEKRVIELKYPGSVDGSVPLFPVLEPISDAVPQATEGSEFNNTELLQNGPDSVLGAHPEFEATSMFDMLAFSHTVTADPKQPPSKVESSHLGLDQLDFGPPSVQPEFEATGLMQRDDPSTITAPLETSAAPLYSAFDFDLPSRFSSSHDNSTSAAQGQPSTLPPVFAASQTQADEPEEAVKHIGSLRIGIPLYNVYLNEADEWSRRLSTELSEWALELHRPLPDSIVSLAHSLGGSSATVGFSALSEIARELEQALQHVQLHRQREPEHAQVFMEAAEEIRRLLHQFAAGFLKDPDARVLRDLNAIVETEFAASTSGDLDDLNFTLEEEPPLEAEPEAEFLEVPAEPAHIDVIPVAPPAPPAPAYLATTTQPAPFVPVAPVVATVAAVALPAATLVLSTSAEVLGSDDDDIDLADSLDADLFPIFEEEAQELLPQLGGALRQWSQQPDNLKARGETLRVLHTLKGSARLAGALRLGEMTHRMESVIEQLGADDVQASQLDPLLARFDDILGNFEALRKMPGQAFALPEGGVGTAEQLASVAAAPATAAPPVASAARLAPSGATLTAARQITNQSVRVRSQLLDRLVNQAGEVMITRSRLEARLDQMHGSMADLSGNLDRLRHQLRDIEVQAESQMQSRMALAKESAQQFDPLEFDRFTRVQELTRMMAESVNDVATVQRNLQRSVEGTEDDLIAQGRQARELQRDLLRTRMVEFEGISERLYGVVRQAAKETGKQVKLDITGGSLDVDRGVLERMAPAFEHLLRNSVAHGIESPEARAKSGKPAVGTISIALQHQSNELSVNFSDDGGGLDLAAIRAKAISSGVAANANELSDDEAANLIFLPGFSTAQNVSEMAGRGIGMDVVRSEMNALGGRIETTTEHGKGTHFKLVLPLTTAVTQVVMLRMADLVIGVPANVIEIVRRVPAAELEGAYTTGQFNFSGEHIPFFWSGALLQASSHSNEMLTKNLPVVVLRSAGQRVAIHVDEVLGNQDVVVKNLGPQLARLPGLTGMSVLASGAVVLIYNPVALASVYGEQAKALRRTAQGHAVGAGADQTAPMMPSMMAGVTQVPLVMVVDDSITVRRVTQRLLKREGYRVVMAADGLQALERLQDEKPSVVLSDIEMPRMDGFDLARNIRADARLRDLPIIMITSRIAEKHREHARELGVDHYLGKPYSEDELMRLVRQYCSVLTES
jgi:chemosensory pili system protein ChpA (sensor histidine kinase/response regulator)